MERIAVERTAEENKLRRKKQKERLAGKVSSDTDLQTFAKLPQSSYTDQTKPKMGLLSLLLNPDHPYRKVHSDGNLAVQGASTIPGPSLTAKCIPAFGEDSVLKTGVSNDQSFESVTSESVAPSQVRWSSMVNHPLVLAKDLTSLLEDVQRRKGGSSKSRQMFRLDVSPSSTPPRTPEPIDTKPRGPSVSSGGSDFDNPFWPEIITEDIGSRGFQRLEPILEDNKSDKRGQEQEEIQDRQLPKSLDFSPGIIEEHTTEIDIVLTRLDDILSNRTRFKNLSAQRGEVAQNLLDRLQALSDYPGICEKQRLRSKIFEAMIHISRNSTLYPTCLSLSNVKKVGDDPIAGGSFGDIWRASVGGQTACMKVIRLFDKSEIDMFLKGFLKEAILWRQLRHPNVLPFLGLYFLDDSRKRICLISPMIENGNLNSYLAKHSEKEVHCVTLAYDVSCGLSYLHKMKIIHGDLKGVCLGANVLITAAGRAAIADFGLSHVADSELHKWASLSTSSHSNKGTTRWLAPECLEGGRVSYASDVYAFACVCYEIFTGLLPFHELKDSAVILKVIRGQRPNRPDNTVHRQLSNSMWTIIQQCWNQEPDNRPEANVLPSRVALANEKVIKPADDWDMSLPTELWSSLRHPELYPTAPDLEELLLRLETDTALEPIRKSVQG
ncbi:kinase-like protein [Dendrothele bispora CBS 962.96]|uniref:Kinase-like protein n=1 Tax=Dendrothele bispora (strain CBS 962.96) TaxID=1314807 RepID=A0A4S8KXF1_DENBC|nr:kinase-like protein [Dendrothele bispora CBS 962.96]